MGKNRVNILWALLFLTTTALGQKNRYMVFFSDKSGTPFSVSVPTDFLSPAAIERRVKHEVPVAEMDLPVNPDYVSAVAATGAEVYFRTRWLNGVLVQADAQVVAGIEGLPFVERVELVAPGARLLSGGRRKIIERRKGSKASEATDNQLEMIGLDAMHTAGFRGEGVTIAILDSGFEGVDMTDPFKHILTDNRINLEVSKDFVYNSDNVFQYDDHGTEVFSVIAAYQPDVFTGGAYEASFQLYVTEETPTEYRVEEYNWLFAAERADSAGVDIIQSSLGYYDFDLASMDYLKSQMNGSVAIVSRAAQWAADRGIVVVVSAGNEGNISWQIITAPADAEDVLAVANVDSNQRRAASSSTGPSADLRVKPDLAAMGVGTSVIEKSGATGKSSGTSLAAPLITSLAAGVLQKYPHLTNKQLLDAIRLSSSQASNPDFLLGYGIPHFKAVVNYLEADFGEDIFEVYPNPFREGSDSLVIRTSDPTKVSDCTIELISAEGKSIQRYLPNFTWLKTEFSPQLSGLAAGVYFLRIASGGKKYFYKVIRHQ